MFYILYSTSTNAKPVVYPLRLVNSSCIQTQCFCNTFVSLLCIFYFIESNMGRTKKDLGEVVKQKKDNSRKRPKIVYGGTKEYTNMDNINIKLSLEKAKEKLEKAKNRQQAASTETQNTQATSRAATTTTTTSAAASSAFFFESGASYGEGLDDGPSQPSDLWRMWGKQMVDWYVESMAVEEAQASLIDPQQPEIHCQCTKKTKVVTLYMLGGKP